MTVSPITCCVDNPGNFWLWSKSQHSSVGPPADFNSFCLVSVTHWSAALHRSALALSALHLNAALQQRPSSLHCCVPVDRPAAKAVSTDNQALTASTVLAGVPSLCCLHWPPILHVALSQTYIPIEQNQSPGITVNNYLKREPKIQLGKTVSKKWCWKNWIFTWKN